MTPEFTLLRTDSATELLAYGETPCISLYQPTHRHHPANQQDPLRFRHLLEKAERSLAKRHDAATIRALLAPFEELLEVRTFWNHTLDGLAVFGAPGLFRIYRLQRSVRELVVVAGSFHTKPLWRFQQTADRFQVLGVSRHDVKLFEGNRDALDPVDLAPEVPKTIQDALGDELTEKHQTVASYGGSRGAGTGGGKTPMRHSHGGKKDEVDGDTERFFRVIDRAILEHHTRPSGLPLMLAALPEHHGVFHQVSHSPMLMAEGVKVHPDAVSRDNLRERAWKIVEPIYLARLATLAEEFGTAQARGRGLSDVSDIAVAAIAGRVGTLLIEEDRQIAGRLDRETGRIDFDDLGDPDLDDLLDDLGETVLTMGGSVVVVPADRMPTDSGAAATLRF